MRLRHLAVPLCLAGLISSTSGALAAPGEVIAAANLRTGPGQQYYAIMTLPPGTPIEIYGCLNDANWCDVAYGNTRGWLTSRYIGTARSWSPEDQIMQPPVFSPPPIYREPPVYANPPPVYRVPRWAPPPVYPDGVYIEPPPTYVYRPPTVEGPQMPDLPQPGVGVYRPKQHLQPMPQVAQPPVAVNTPSTTARPAPVAPTTTVTQPTVTAPATTAPAPTVTQPSTTTAPSVATSASPTTSTTPPATQSQTKYGGAVGKPGAPCKWVNGVCRND